MDHTAYTREYRQKRGPEYIRALNLRASHSMTIVEYDAMFNFQGGKCAACRKPETARNQFGLLRLAVDHDHTTGKVRGLLCMRCNRALGLLGDSLKNIQELLLYKMGVSECVYTSAAQ
jgi:hypothetical protein